MVFSMVVPFLTAGVMGAGFARLTYLVFELMEGDGEDSSTDSRIARLDRFMRALNKPRLVVTDEPDEKAGAGVFTAEQWPVISVADMFFSECRTQCDAPCGAPCGATVAADDDAGPVPRVLESRFPSKKAAPVADAAGGGDCYVCMDRDANSVLLPCGHSGVCYECAIENVARCETCPCCRQAVNQVVVFDRGSRHRDGEKGRFAYRVIGPGPLKAA